jgi:hypothetical protein
MKSKEQILLEEAYSKVKEVVVEQANEHTSIERVISSLTKVLENLKRCAQTKGNISEVDGIEQTGDAFIINISKLASQGTERIDADTFKSEQQDQLPKEPSDFIKKD